MAAGRLTSSKATERGYRFIIFVEHDDVITPARAEPNGGLEGETRVPHLCTTIPCFIKWRTQNKKINARTHFFLRCNSRSVNLCTCARTRTHLYKSRALRGNSIQFSGANRWDVTTLWHLSPEWRPTGPSLGLGRPFLPIRVTRRRNSARVFVSVPCL